MKLTNPTNEQLNEAFVTEVMKRRIVLFFGLPTMERLPIPESDLTMPTEWIPDFVNSADAVLPWLEKHVVKIEHHCSTWIVTIHKGYLGDIDNPFKERLDFIGSSQYPPGPNQFPKAAVIALLRAHGVEVVP